MIKREVDNKLKKRIFLGLMLIGLMFLIGIYNKTITGNTIIPAITGETCNDSATTYDGSFMEIISPLNNSYTGKDNFNFTAYTDYYGEDIVTTCEGEEPVNCTLELMLALISDDDKELYFSFELPKTNEGNKTYTSTAAQSSNNYTNGNYTMLTKIKYSCIVATFERDERRIQVDIEEPNITEIYPLNNAIINISTNSTTTIFYKLNATDSIGIANRTITKGSKVTSMIQNPNYNETLTPGSYTYTFAAIDLAGNTKSVTSSFRIINSSTNETEIPVENETNETVINATIYFDTTTTVNNAITNLSILNVKLIANASTTTNMTFRIYDSTGRIVYQNSTSQKTFNITHMFISDGVYSYNATLVAGDQTINSATRKITLDTESPTITITQKTQTVFTNEVILELQTQDTNKVARTWINDGAKEFDYTGKLNKTLIEGNYTWTIYSIDEAGNTAKEIFKFSIIEEKATSSTKIIAIILIIVAVILTIVLIAMYFLRKTPGNNPANQNPSTMMPPANSPMQFNRPMPPRPINPNIPPQTNPAMFKNNPYQR